MRPPRRVQGMVDTINGLGTTWTAGLSERFKGMTLVSASMCRWRSCRHLPWPRHMLTRECHARPPRLHVRLAA